MATFRHTNVGDATARNNYASASQVQDSALISAGSVAGTNTITASLAPSITAYVTNMLVVFKPAATNSGAATIALNGLSAKSIVKYASTALAANDLVSGAPALLIYDGTNFVLLNPGNGVPNITVAAAGNVTIGAPTSGTALTVNNSSAGPSITQKIASSFGSTSTTPLLSLLSTASGGFAILSICGNNGTVGTNDLSIFQNGSTGDASVLNRNSGSDLILDTTGSNAPVIIKSNGTTVATFSGSASHVSIGVGGSADSIRFNTLTQTSVGAAGGATALPATPLGYMTVSVNGASVKIPYYNA